MVTVSGTVTESGTAIENATVDLINHSNQDVYSASTDANGDWSINVPTGTYHFVARYEDAEGKKRTLSKPYISVT